MPELPEVETVRIGLAKLLPGRKITSVTSDWEKSFPNAKSDVDTFLIGAMVLRVRRRAKVLLIDFDTEYSLVIHLKMTGQLVFVSKHPEDKHPKLNSNGEVKTGQKLKPEIRFGAGHPNDSLISTLPDRSTRVILTFLDNSHLYFNDQRKFGWMKLFPAVEVPSIDFFKRVGPEPLADDFTSDDFKQRLARRPRTTIKAALLDQSVIAGVGNIYADESLWGARIHPATRVDLISSKKSHTLYDELQFVLRLAIEKGGSTDKNYVNAEGKRGSYMDFARVFRREGLACPRCSTLIVKSRVAGRGTHTCPRCQKLTKE